MLLHVGYHAHDAASKATAHTDQEVVVHIGYQVQDSVAETSACKDQLVLAHVDHHIHEILIKCSDASENPDLIVFVLAAHHVIC